MHILQIQITLMFYSNNLIDSGSPTKNRVFDCSNKMGISTLGLNGKRLNFKGGVLTGESHVPGIGEDKFVCLVIVHMHSCQ